jgi:transcription antitermination protein NusB
MQAVYAFLQEGPEDINIGEKQLLNSLNKLYELYIHQLSFILEVWEFARRRMEDSKLKFLPTAEDLNPNTRFLENSFLAQLEANRDLKKKIESFKINWSDEEEMLRKCYNIFRDHPDYQSYMLKEKTSYADDKNIIELFFSKIIADYELLRSYYEEKNLFWTEDFDTSLIMVSKTLKGYNEKWDEYVSLPTLLKDENDPEGSEDLAFVKHLYRKVLIHSKDFTSVIASHADNWDIERIALVDTILIKMALTEFIDFPSIPVKVTLNEYIELSKNYSTPKSKVFINGMLDKLIAEFKQDGKIIKTGRGLME